MPEISPHLLSKSNSGLIGNRLLDTLDSKHLEDLLAHSESVPLDLAQLIHLPYHFFKYVYFPTNGVISILCVMEDGREAEVSAIGREGLVGSALTLGQIERLARQWCRSKALPSVWKHLSLLKLLSVTKSYMHFLSVTFNP